MITRCESPRNHRFHRYGGRGITVCERWRHDFTAFLADMGEKPSPAHSIDRINNDGNYEPANCRWATAKEQANNRGPFKEVPGPAAAEVVDGLKGWIVASGRELPGEPRA